MSKKVCFIGHRDFYKDDLLKNEIENQIKQGADFFTMGTHGKFDQLALWFCKEFRKKYENIKIEVVITSFNKLKKILIHDDIYGKEYYDPYKDVDTVMFEIEELYFKKRITESNKQMIDGCDVLVCYVNPKKTYGGAKFALDYATKKGLKIVNLYDKKN